MISIHGRVRRAAALVTISALLLAGFAAYLLIRDELFDGIDHQLLDQALLLGGHLDYDKVHGWSVRDPPPEEPGAGYAIRVQDRVVARSGERDITALAVGPDGTPTTASTAHGHALRMVRLALPFTDDDLVGKHQMIEVTVARDQAATDRTVTGITVALLAACAAGCLLVIAILGRVARAALQPLTTLGSCIATLDPRDQRERIPVDDVPRELEPIVAQLEALLGRSREALSQERAFAAAAAHELRTPLAGLRATLDVALARERDPAYWRDAAQRCHGIIVHLERVTTGLLFMARHHAGQATAAVDPCDLAKIVADTEAGFAEEAARLGRTVRSDLPAQAAVRGPAGLVIVLVRTLLDNAISHGSGVAPIAISLVRRSAGPEAPAWVLTMANAGCDVPPEDAQRVFSPFWRGDRARSSVDGHTGLGLAIATAAAATLGAGLQAAINGDRFTVTVVMPAYAPACPDSEAGTRC